jgi:hypothetical protein
MLREDLIFVGTCEIAGYVRGKGFPACELPGGMLWPGPLPDNRSL